MKKFSFLRCTMSSKIRPCISGEYIVESKICKLSKNYDEKFKISIINKDFWGMTKVTPTKLLSPVGYRFTSVVIVKLLLDESTNLLKCRKTFFVIPSCTRKNHFHNWLQWTCFWKIAYNISCAQSFKFVPNGSLDFSLDFVKR